MKRFKHAISFAMAIVMIASISSAMAAEPTNELSMSPQAERNFNAISQLYGHTFWQMNRCPLPRSMRILILIQRLFH